MEINFFYWVHQLTSGALQSLLTFLSDNNGKIGDDSEFSDDLVSFYNSREILILSEDVGLTYFNDSPNWAQRKIQHF